MDPDSPSDALLQAQQALDAWLLVPPPYPAAAPRGPTAAAALPLPPGPLAWPLDGAGLSALYGWPALPQQEPRGAAAAGPAAAPGGGLPAPLAAGLRCLDPTHPPGCPRCVSRVVVRGWLEDNGGEGSHPRSRPTAFLPPAASPAGPSGAAGAGGAGALAGAARVAGKLFSAVAKRSLLPALTPTLLPAARPRRPTETSPAAS